MINKHEQTFYSIVDLLFYIRWLLSFVWRGLPWCWPPMESRAFIGGEGQRWATARLWPTRSRRQFWGEFLRLLSGDRNMLRTEAVAPRIKLRTPAALSSLSQTEFKKKTCCSPQYQDKFFIHCLAESGKKGKRHKRIHRTKPLSIQNSGYIQKLCPLGEAHSIVSSLQLRVLSQLGAHHGHLLIDVHEKAIFRVLQEERREKFKEWRGEHDAADQSGCRAASPWILTAKYDKVKLLFFCLTQPVPPALQMSYVRWTNLSEPAAERRTRAVAIVSLWFLGKTFGYLQYMSKHASHVKPDALAATEIRLITARHNRCCVFYIDLVSFWSSWQQRFT